MADDASDGRATAADPDDVATRAEECAAEGRPFARVTVVRREPPVSANVGDRALVTADGDLTGWVGGAACAQSVAAREAVAAIEDGEPRLVGLAPDPEDVDRPGLEAYPMTCHSGGTLELYVEPVVPTPRLLVVGGSPVARSLARMAPEAGFAVTAVTADDDAPVDGAEETLPAADGEAVVDAAADAAAVVVCSMGEYDDLGVAAGLRGEAAYVGLVASDARRDELAATVAECLGVDAADVGAAVTTPAGVDVGAETPGEMAVSVLAELVAVRRDATAGAVDVGDTSAVAVDDTSAADVDGADGDPASGAGEAGTAVVDPVCGMDVVVGEAPATVEYAGERYHFCGHGCADAFADDPGRYLDDAGPEVRADD
jgi:xanthine dehydrogenase accessory factor